MDFQNKKHIKTLILIIFGSILFYLGMQNIDALVSHVSGFYAVISPFVLGAVIAFILNVPMSSIEHHLFQKRGSIINLSSIVGLEGNPGQLVYSATKGAVAAMTKTAAKELASQGIRVNAVAPGMIDTDMFRSIGDEKMKEHMANIRMGRLGTPEEVADVILFLASDLSRYTTGEIIGVNGSAMI